MPCSVGAREAQRLVYVGAIPEEEKVTRVEEGAICPHKTPAAEAGTIQDRRIWEMLPRGCKRRAAERRIIPIPESRATFCWIVDAVRGCSVEEGRPVGLIPILNIFTSQVDAERILRVDG